MANFGKLKRSNTLGTPPDDASPNLDAPETAPLEAPAAEPVKQVSVAKPVKTAPQAETPPSVVSSAASEPIALPTPQPAYQREFDGRSARRSNRTVQFATRVTPEFDKAIREIARHEGRMLVEIMELALQAYQKDRS